MGLKVGGGGGGGGGMRGRGECLVEALIEKFLRADPSMGLV